MRRWLARNLPARRRVTFALILVAAPVIALLVTSGSNLSGAELSSVKLRFEIRGSQEAPKDVVVVAIDSGTINTYQPNWRKETPSGPQALDRALLARFFGLANRAGARAVAVNLYFQAINPGSSSSDRLFLESIGRLDGRFVAGIRCPAEGDVGRSTTRLGSSLILESQGAEMGSLCLLDDQQVRQVPLRVAGAQGFLVATAKASGNPVSQDAFYPDSRVDNPSERFAWIDFYGPPGTVRTLPFDFVMEGADRARLNQEFRDKVIVLGWTNGLLRGSDELNTFAPGDDRMYAPEVWAQAVATMLEGFPLREPGSWVNLVLVIVFGVSVPLIAIFSRPRYWLPPGLGLTGVLLVGTQLSFELGWVTELVPPLVALGISFASGGLIAYLKSTDEIRDLRIRFADQEEDAVKQVIAGATVGARLAPEAIIPGYRILDLIGKGGSGTVYRAASQRSGQVALKIIRPVLADDPQVRAQFKRELQTSKRFTHPNAVRLLNGGESDGIFFVASELATGGDLEARIRELGPMSPAEVLRVAGDVGGCLSAAHKTGIVHRDIKPSNIYIDGDRYLLGDFGIAHISGESSTFMAGTSGPGTIAYAAPEQLDAAGTPDQELGPTADVYSFAATLFALLTGRPPFLAETIPGTIAAKTSGREPALDSPSLPYATVLRKALNPDPEARPQTVEELLEALGRAAW